MSLLTKFSSKYNVLFLVFFAAFVVSLSSASSGVLADHTADVDLMPEWSAANQVNYYTMETCNNGPDSIDEVRIFANPNYSDFDCVELSGWTLVEIEDFPSTPFGVPTDMCWYYTASPLESGYCEMFNFSATVPSSGCDFIWYIETRDEQGTGAGDWETWNDTTSVDDISPRILKTLTGPQVLKDDEIWITYDTLLNVKVYDRGDCGISGLDYCEYRYDVDGVEHLPWTEIEWDLTEEIEEVMHYYYSFSYDEDSLHHVEIRCYDIAKNMEYHEQWERVDDTDPETTKTFSDPKKIVPIPGTPFKIPGTPFNIEWVDTFTNITLNPEDPDPTDKNCNIGVDKTWYRNDLSEDLLIGDMPADEVCYQPEEYCNEEYVGVDTPYEQEAWEGCIDYWQEFCVLEMEYTPGTEDWYTCVEDNVHGAWDLPGLLGCMVDEEWKLYRGVPITKDEESCHVLQFFSIDHLGNTEGVNYNCFFVDHTIPKLEKTHDESAIEDFEEGSFPETDGIFHWVNYDTDIIFDCVDQNPHPSRGERVCFQVSFDEPGNEWLTEEYCSDHYPNGEMLDMEPGGDCGESCEYCCVPVDGNNQFILNFWEESMHDLHYFCEDAVWKGRPGHGFDEPFLQYYRVDNTPPEITKTMLGDENVDWIGACPPQSPSDECYVVGGSGVDVDVTDPDTTGRGCASDDVTCDYEVWWDVNESECHSTYPQSLYQNDMCLVESGSFDDDGTDITFNEDSEHLLKINCWDALGNEMSWDDEKFLVDMEPPVTTKTYGDPTRVLEDCVTYRWINSSTPITLTAVDEKVGVEYITYRVTNVGEKVCPEVCDETGSGDWTTVGGIETQFTIGDDSCHYIEFYSEDMLGNREITNTQCVMVDNVGPEPVKEVGTPSVEGEGSGEGHCEGTPDSVACTYYTEDQCLAIPGCDWTAMSYKCVGEEGCSEHWDEPSCTAAECTWTEYTFGCVGMPESCEAVAANWPTDPEGKCLETVGCDWVLDIAPDWWVTKNTQIELSCDDSWNGTVPHPVDHETIYWRFSNWDDGFEGTPTYDPVDDWYSQPYNGEPVVVNFPEDCWHDLEFYCVDELGNTGMTDTEYFIVETVAPTINKTVTGPQVNCTVYDGDLECFQVDSVTEVHIDAYDPEPHPIGDVTCDWWYEWQEDEYHAEYNGTHWLRVGGKEEDVAVPFSFSFPEESEHTLHVYCEDGLENAVDDVEVFVVDKTPPRIDKDYGWPHYSEEVCIEWGSPLKGCSGFCPEVCIDWETAEWISNRTKITLNIDDTEGPHDSGVAESKYRYDIVDDEYCWGILDCQDAPETEKEWIVMDDPEYGEFYINEESCHLIEIYSEDNVGKSKTHKQCVFVDNTGPEPVKTVGEPKDEWTPGENGDPESYFYPEETAHCWDETNESIECWEATELTPILMDCDDSWDGDDTHPVGEKKVCFKVDVDGEDETRRYCQEYGGWYNRREGYCCRWIGPEVDGFDFSDCEFFGYKDKCDEVQSIECYNNRKLFYFLEETEHNLKYYCVDKLWNKGPVDDEKFKVEGNKFEIPLFKKWNMISVPFTLLNDDPEVVFDKIYFDGEQIPYEEIGDYIDSVWTYDPETCTDPSGWCVWTPGEAPDNLKIRPGWGYWVMVKDMPEEECGFRPRCFWHEDNEDPLWMVMGGSLFSPATTPPSRNLQPGWNLVGYYGVKWNEYDWGDFDFVCGDSYQFPDKVLYGDKTYCALNSLIDTQEGYPRWSSLWSFVNCGNHDTYWLGLNSCPDSDSPMPFLNSMYAGRGYWVEMDVNDIYAPATNCIWNEDFECIWTGSGGPV